MIWTLAGIILVFSYTAYEHRSDLFNAATSGQSTMIAGNPVGAIFEIGNTTKKNIETFVKAEKSVVGFTVVSADIRLNVRNQIFFFPDPTVPNPPTLLPLQAFSRLPLFTKNDEANRQMIKLINGEFTCAPYATTSLVAQVSPSTNTNVITICRASLPPYYGHFSGFVSVLLNTDPDIEEQVRLKQTIESMATEIYFRDVILTTKKVKI